MALQTAGGVMQALRSLPAGTSIQSLPVQARPPLNGNGTASFTGSTGNAINPVNVRGIRPLTTPAARTAAGGVATGSSAAGALATPVGSTPPGVIAATSALAFAGGLLVGDAVYEAMGEPFGPSLSDHFLPGGNGLLDGFGLFDGIAGEREQTNNRPEGPPAYTGGQSPGVLYRISLSTFSFNDEGVKNSNNHTTEQRGPIVIDGVNTGSSSPESGFNTVRVSGSTGFKDYKRADRVELFFENVNIERVDGQPDTGGNPAATPIRERVTPAIPPVFDPAPPPSTTPDQVEEPNSTPSIIPNFDFPELPNLESTNPIELVPLASAGLLPSITPGITPDTGNQGQPPTKKPPVGTKPKPDCKCGPTVDAVGDLLNNQVGQIADIPELALLAKIADAVGVSAFPATMPANLNGKATGTRSLSNLAELGVYNVEALDSVMGQYPMQIQTEDGTNVSIDTASDAQQEIIGMLMSMSIGQGLSQQGIMKTLVETTGIKQQSLLAAQYAQANAEFLGYRGNRTRINAPNTYTPGAENILDMLNPGNVPMQGFRNDDSDDLQTCLRELCAAAAIIRAVYFRQVDTNDVEGSIRQRFDSARATRDGVQQAIDDLDDFIQSVEAGYGLTDPYGRSEANYPKIYNRSATNGNQSQP